MQFYIYLIYKHIHINMYTILYTPAQHVVKYDIGKIDILILLYKHKQCIQERRGEKRMKTFLSTLNFVCLSRRVLRNLVEEGLHIISQLAFSSYLQVFEKEKLKYRITFKTVSSFQTGASKSTRCVHQV